MKQLICLMLLLWVKASVLGQPVCGFDQNHLQFGQHFPDAARVMKENEKKIRSVSISGRGRQVFYIPVVVHILHTGDTLGSPSNPHDESISDAIDYLNEIYSGQHSSLTVAGQDAAGDIGIRFQLAMRDPDCNPTNGIRRVNMSGNQAYLENGALNANIEYDTRLKTPIAWDIGRYYNIYIVNKINGKDGQSGQYVAGFAYFPTNHIVDGTVMLASEMKRDSKTLIHEIGHAFNLYHPFEGSGHRDQCPSGDGDFVDDTDPVSKNADDDGTINFTCRTGINPCNQLPYSMRTEHNIMNYTACYSLFTPGQKERMLASLELEPRASLIASDALLPTYEGNENACAPKINFEVEEALLHTPFDKKTDCRAYRDFTFYLTISNTPSEKTTINLSPGEDSEGKEKIDFDFVKGKQLIFPAGSREKRPFTIRVYDNGQPLKLSLSFTVNGGKGNVTKGTAIPVMYLRIQPESKKPVVDQSVSLSVIGSTNHIIEDAFLFDANQRTQKSVMQYNKAELLNAGLQPGRISGIQLSVVKNTTRPFLNLRIRVGHTTSPALVVQGDITTGDMLREVFFAASYTTVHGRNSFTFSEPFDWNGEDNIRIEMCFDNQVASEFSENDPIEAFSDGSSFEVSNFLTSQHACEASFSNFSNYGDGIKPVIVFAQITAGNPVVNSKTASQDVYLGPYGEAYFYDESTPQRVIASIKNLSDWNYGCTKIEVDRAGDRAFPFWNVNPQQFITEKTFLVKPQFNAADAAYEISLYYTAAEKEGYEQATGNRWNRVQLVKTSGIPAGTVNPLNRQLNTISLTGNVRHDSFGQDYVVTGAFAGLNDRSGFSSGLIDSTLPLNWLQFDATTIDSYVLLKWKTLNETQASHFELECSNDGITFRQIGQLNALNNRDINTYEYQLDNPGNGIWFYRLKQVDRDLRYTYSQVVRVRLAGEGETLPAMIYPVPARNQLTVDFGKTISNATIRILSADLKPIQTETLRGATQKTNLSVGRLPAGTYLMQVIAPDGHFTIKFIKY